MIITKEQCIAFNACRDGLDDMINLFPEGGTYEEVLREAKRLDLMQGDRDREAFIRTLRLTLIKQDRQGTGTTMQNTFKVFNPLIGQYQSYTSPADAKNARDIIINDYIAANSGLFSIAQEAITSTGDAIWIPLTSLELQQQIV